MSDQMPDEVWLDETEVWVPHACDAVRYIRADLCEQAEAEQRLTASRLAEVLMQYTAARAERDRLRAALDRIVEPRAWATPGYLRHIAQEALDHD